MNFFEQELRRFTGRTTAFKSCKALYAGRACFIPLSGSRRARLEFVTSGVADQYDALQVTILSTTDGKIDCLRFRFSDFLAPRKARTSGSTAAGPSGTSRPPPPKSPPSPRPPTTTSCSSPELLNREEDVYDSRIQDYPSARWLLQGGRRRLEGAQRPRAL